MMKRTLGLKLWLAWYRSWNVHITDLRLIFLIPAICWSLRKELWTGCFWPRVMDTDARQVECATANQDIIDLLCQDTGQTPAEHVWRAISDVRQMSTEWVSEWVKFLINVVKYIGPNHSMFWSSQLLIGVMDFNQMKFVQSVCSRWGVQSHTHTQNANMEKNQKKN